MCNINIIFETADIYSSTGRASSDFIYEGGFLVDLCRDSVSAFPVEMVITLHANVLYYDFLFECLSV